MNLEERHKRSVTLRIIAKQGDKKGAITGCPECNGYLHYDKSHDVRAWCVSCGYKIKCVSDDYRPGGPLYQQSSGHFGPSDD